MGWERACCWLRKRLGAAARPREEGALPRLADASAGRLARGCLTALPLSLQDEAAEKAIAEAEKHKRNQEANAAKQAEGQ